MPSRSATTPAHPGLTITTYRIDPSTMERGQRRTRHVDPEPTPPVSHCYPPCECPRHREGRP